MNGDFLSGVRSSISKLYEHTSLIFTINLNFAEWANILGNAKMTTALFDARGPAPA